jgi:hypothetical protein
MEQTMKNLILASFLVGSSLASLSPAFTHADDAPQANPLAVGTGNTALTAVEIEALQQFINRSKVALEDALRQAEGQGAVNTYAILRQAIQQVIATSAGNEPHRELILRVLLNQALALTDGVPNDDGVTLRDQPILPANASASTKAMVLKASVQLALSYVAADQANVTAQSALPAPYLKAANERLTPAFGWSQTVLNSGEQLKVLVSVLQHWLNMLTLPEFTQLPQISEVVLRVQNTLGLAHAGLGDRAQHPLIRTRVVRDIRAIMDQGTQLVHLLNPNSPAPALPVPVPAQTQTPTRSGFQPGQRVMEQNGDHSTIITISRVAADDRVLTTDGVWFHVDWLHPLVESYQGIRVGSEALETFESYSALTVEAISDNGYFLLSDGKVYHPSHIFALVNSYNNIQVGADVVETYQSRSIQRVVKISSNGKFLLSNGSWYDNSYIQAVQ